MKYIIVDKIKEIALQKIANYILFKKLYKY